MRWRPAPSRAGGGGGGKPATRKTWTGSSKLLNIFSPRSSKDSSTFRRTLSNTMRETVMPPGGAAPSTRAAVLTPSPKMSPPSWITSPTCRPMRN